MTNQLPIRTRALLAAALAFFTLALSPAHGQTATWNGAGSDNHWSTGANWGGTAPVANNNLTFAGTTRLLSINDIAADTTFGNFTFNSGAGAFTLSGNRITLSSSSKTIQNSSSNTQTIALGMILSNGATIRANAGAIVLSGNLSGAGQIFKSSTAFDLTLSGNNTFDGRVEISRGNLTINSINSVGSGQGASALGTASTANNGQIALGDAGGANSATLIYTGAAAATDRQVIFNGRDSGANAALDQSGTGLLKFTSNLGFLSGSGSSITRTLTLQGSTAGTGEFAGVIANQDLANGKITALSKAGSGTWVLSRNNTYTGATTINAGTLSIAAITNGGVAGALGNSTNAAGNLVLGGGTLEYTGTANGTTDRNFTITAGTTSGISVSNSTVSLTISGAAAATTGNLTKSGAGTLILSGNNAYTGATTINAGTLSIAAIANGGVAGALGNSTNAAGNLVLGGGTLEYTGTANGTTDRNFTITAGTTSGISVSNSTVSLTISGAAAATTGNLTKSGAGTLILSGNNAYTGATTINAGTLSIAAIANGGVAGALGNSTNAAGNLVLGGGTLEYTGTANGTTDRNFTLTAGTTSGISVSNSTVSLTISGAAAATTGSLTKSGVGTLILSGNNAYTGATTVSGGILQFAKTASLYNGTAASWTPSNIRAASGGTLAFNVGGTGEFSTGNMTTLLANLGGANGGTSAGFASGSRIGFDTTNASGSSFMIADVIANSTGSGGGAIGLTKIGTGTLILSGNNTYTGATTINAGTLEIAATGRLGGSSYAGSILNNGTFTFNGSNAQTLSGVISGNGALTKNNSSTLTLPGSNTYSGGTTINAGGITASNVGAFGVGNVTIASGALATLNTGTYSNNFTINGNGGANGAIQAGSSMFTTLTGALALTGDTTIGSRGFSGNSSLTLKGGITTGGTNRTLTLNIYGDANRTVNFITIDTNSVNLGTGGTLDIGAGIQASGTGTVNLNVGNNTWGTTIVRSNTGSGSSSNATLNLGAANALGGSGAVLQLGNSNTALEGITVNLNGNSQTIGGLRSFGSTGSASGNGTRTVTSATDATLTIDNSSATNYLYNGVISGATSLTKNGTGTQTLSGNNTYTGTTTVAGGTLLLSGNGTLGTSTISISGGTLDMGGKSLTNTFGSLTGGTLSNGTLTNNGGNYDLQNGTVSAVLAGTNGVNKTASGTVTLSRANNYSGTTTVSSGTLTAATAGATGNTSNVVINNGGSFLVTADDAIGTNTDIELNGGTLAFGAAGYDGYVGALTLSANSTIDLGTSSNGVLIRFNSINWNNPNALLSIYNWTGNTYYQGGYDNNLDKVIFTDSANLSSVELQRINFYSGMDQSSFVGNAFLIQGGAYPNQIIAVPEPETYLTGVILLLGGTIYLFRRAKHWEGNRPAWPKFLHGIRRTTPRHHYPQKPPEPHLTQKGAWWSRA
jgi:autotransporter-associated beta strand protein